MIQKVTIARIKNFVKSRYGGQCLSKHIGYSKILLWKCCRGHIWRDRLNHVLYENRWCGSCIREEYKENVIYKIEKKFKCKCLSRYLKKNKNLKWICKRGHKHNTSVRNIKYSGFICATCSNEKRKYIGYKQIKELVKNNKGNIVTGQYINARSVFTIKCNNGHVWKTFPNRLKSGKWCPYCCSHGKPRREKIKSILSEIFPSYNININTKEFEWLIGPGGKRMEIDFFIFNRDKSFTMAIEFDGEQHFRPVNFGGCSDGEALKNFKMTRKRDNIKNRLIGKFCNEIKYFVRIPYAVQLTKESLKAFIESKVPQLKGKI